MHQIATPCFNQPASANRSQGERFSYTPYCQTPRHESMISLDNNKHIECAMPKAALKPSRRRLLQAASGLAVGSLISPRLRAAEKSDVIVIGAGFAGLNTAIMLADEGFSVTVLEANSRVGGRAFTADHIYGKPELGANQVGPYYARVRDMAHRLNIELAPGANINAPLPLPSATRWCVKKTGKATNSIKRWAKNAQSCPLLCRAII